MYTLNPYFRIRLGPPAVVDLFLDNKEVELPHPYFIQFIPYFQEPGNEKSIVDRIEKFCDFGKTASEIAAFFIENNILVPESSSYDLEGVKHWVNRGWGDALQLHLKTQCLTYEDDSDPDVLQVFPENFSIQFWKDYKGAVSLKLPDAAELPNRDIEDVLLSRRTGGINIGKKLDLRTLSAILLNANQQSLDIRLESERLYKEKPEILYNSSFTALETYVVVYDVEGLIPGIYFYDMKTHSLILINEGDFREKVGKFCLGQRYAGMGACTFMISAVWERYMKRYAHARAYRNLLINTAELAHKYILLATTFKLGNFLTPALRDEMSIELIKEPQSKESILYIVTIG